MAAQPPLDRQHLIEQHLGLVEAYANRIAHSSSLPSCIDRDELVAWGFVGLAEAARRYRPRRGTKFATYANHLIHGRIIDGLRRMDWLPRALRLEIKAGTQAKVRQVPLDCPVKDDLTVRELLEAAGPAASECAEHRELASIAMRKVFGKHREIIRQYFFEHKTMAEIGDSLGLTESRICQVANEAMGMIREAVGSTAAGSAFYANKNRRHPCRKRRSRRSV